MQNGDMAARTGQGFFRSAGEQGDRGGPGGGDKMKRACVIANGQNGLGAQQGDLGEIGAAGQVSRPADSLLDGAGQGAFLGAADDHDVIAEANSFPANWA